MLHVFRIYLALFCHSRNGNIEECANFNVTSRAIRLLRMTLLILYDPGLVIAAALSFSHGKMVVHLLLHSVVKCGWGCPRCRLSHQSFYLEI